MFINKIINKRNVFFVLFILQQKKKKKGTGKLKKKINITSIIIFFETTIVSGSRLLQPNLKVCYYCPTAADAASHFCVCLFFSHIFSRSTLEILHLSMLVSKHYLIFLYASLSYKMFFGTRSMYECRDSILSLPCGIFSIVGFFFHPLSSGFSSVRSQCFLFKLVTILLMACVLQCFELNSFIYRDLASLCASRGKCIYKWVHCAPVVV